MSAGLERLGPYRLLRELGRGGMGVVYEVEREDTGGRFALKTLTSWLTGDPELAARFVREGQLAARLDHPHVVRTHAASFEGPTPWIVQDLFPGGSLRDRLRASGPLPIDEAVEIVRKVALGLAHAHEKGVLHRDVKPDNVLFDDEGQPRLIDFGVARPTVSGASGPLTATGQVIGSPEYMAPEQAIGDRVDARADVHAAGALLHALLCGDPPFGGASPLEVLEAVISKPPRPLRSLRPDVPVWVERIVLRALAKKPDDRYPSAAALAVALGECRAPPPPPSSRVVPVLVAASVVSLLVALVALLRAGSNGAPAPGVDRPATERPDATIQEPAAPAPDLAAGWPGLGATFAAPSTFEVVSESHDGALDVFRLTLEAQAAVPSSNGRATIAMTVSRIAFQLEDGHLRVNYDSQDPDKPPPPLQGMRELLERALESRLNVELVLRTGEVTVVSGMPNAPLTAVGTLGASLALTLRDDVLLMLLHDTLHLFPEEPSRDTFVATTWIERGFGLRGARKVRRDEGGSVQHALNGATNLVLMQGYTSSSSVHASDAQITARAELEGDRVRSSELEVHYSDKEGKQRHRQFRFLSLPTRRASD